MSYKNIYFILVRPQIGENIGSVARAIKNFNITKLRIINPRCEWPNQKAIVTSVGAKDILKSTKIYNSIEKSIGDLDVIFASTSRIRKVNKKIISIKVAAINPAISATYPQKLTLKLDGRFLTTIKLMNPNWQEHQMLINCYCYNDDLT